MENNFTDGECRTYENLDALRMQVDNTDSASLHFESILENDTEPVQNECTANGVSFVNKREANTSQSSTCANPCANYENDDVTRDRVDYPPKFASFGGAIPKNELIDNVLFNKFREAADTTAITSHSRTTVSNVETVELPKQPDTDDDLSEGKLKDSNSVSCEDLLEFADNKPKGKDRGIESDEVRIMTKVLGTTVSNRIYWTTFLNFNRIFIGAVLLTGNARRVSRSIGLYRMERTSSNQNNLIGKCIEVKAQHYTRGSCRGITKI